MPCGGAANTKMSAQYLDVFITSGVALNLSSSLWHRYFIDAPNIDGDFYIRGLYQYGEGIHPPALLNL